ncbi:hypothetical protein [Lactococcus formosensis]|nr:hypothetical protein [Lactococcus formosensis]
MPKLVISITKKELEKLSNGERLVLPPIQGTYNISAIYLEVEG